MLYTETESRHSFKTTVYIKRLVLYLYTVNIKISPGSHDYAVVEAKI